MTDIFLNMETPLGNTSIYNTNRTAIKDTVLQFFPLMFTRSSDGIIIVVRTLFGKEQNIYGKRLKLVEFFRVGIWSDPLISMGLFTNMNDEWREELIAWSRKWQKVRTIMNFWKIKISHSFDFCKYTAIISPEPPRHEPMKIPGRPVLINIIRSI